MGKRCRRKSMSEGKDLAQLLAEKSRSGMTRRDLLRQMGIGAGGLTVSAWLAACGIQPQGNQAGAGEEELTTNKIVGELNFANWPAYIDKAGGSSPTLDQFTEETGIEVNYKTAVSDNLSFFGTIREPLANGQAVDWDLIVITDWLVSKMANLGYLEALDHTRLGNFHAHAGEIYKDPSYDPRNKYSVPWQSGITGIAYNLELTGREISSSDELFNEEFAGSVGMMTEMRETMNLAILNMGIKPEDATEEDARAAQEMLLAQREAGIVRQYYGNDYVQPLEQGELALTMAWSGDVLGAELSDPNIRFIVPDQGAILWVDNMVIPQNAAHPIDAMEMMNFVYQPEIAAQMTAWINYISPVPETQEILEKSDDSYVRKVAASPLVFPTPEMESRLYHYKTLSPEEEELWDDLFNEVIQG
jgi:spermidine/putrescine transport system substrate-binding protein